MLTVGVVLTAGVGLAAVLCGGVLTGALAGLVPGCAFRTGAGAACVLSRTGAGGLRSSPAAAPAPPATAIAVTMTVANSPTRRGPGRPLAGASW